MKRLAIISCLVILVGCSTTLTQNGKGVKLVKSMPSNCEVIADIEDHDGWAFDSSMVSTKNKLRNRTAEMGGNVFLMDTVHGESNMSGRVLNCSN